MANIGIVGYGIVGKATDYSFKKGNHILFYDKFKKKDVLAGTLKRGLPLEKVVNHSEFIFVCLPTPFSESGQSIDLTIMNENIEEITKKTNNTDKIIIIKSTVIPGTTEGYSEKYKDTHFCFNPEFLTEANYLEDATNPDRIVIGANNDNIRLRVIDLYRNTFPETLIHPTSLTAAEVVKYMANAFLSTKVMFANEINSLCEKLGVEYGDVKKMVVADERIYDSHLDVTSEKGFGGKCFPKDIIALIGLYKSLGVDSSLLETVWKKNLRIRKVKDWEGILFTKSK